jgi:hypothetical protein
MQAGSVIAWVLLASLAAVPAVEARPAAGVDQALRRFPTLGVLVRQLPDGEVAVAECDLFGEPSDACTEASARDLSPVLRLLSLPAKRRAGPDAADIVCTTPVVWHGAPHRPPSFACEVSGDLFTAHVAFACEPREPDGLQYCRLGVSTANEDEDHSYTWDYSVTGAGGALVLGPVVFSYATSN